MRSPVVISLAALVIVSCAGPGSLGSPDKSALLALELNTHDSTVYRYHTLIDLTASSGSEKVKIPTELRGDVTLLVLNRGKDGVAIVSGTVEGVRGTVNGHASTDQFKHEFLVRIGPNAHIEPSTPSGAPSTQMGGVPGNDQFLALLPNRRATPGATWDTQVDAANVFGTGTLHQAATSRYVKSEKLAKVNAAQVDSDITLPVDLDLDVTQLVHTGIVPDSFAAQHPSARLHLKGTIHTAASTWLDLDHHGVLKSRTDSVFSIDGGWTGTGLAAVAAVALSGTQTIELDSTTSTASTAGTA